MRMLTPKGLTYAELPENLERYWAMHARTFRPAPFEGAKARGPPGAGGAPTTEFRVDVTAPSVTVISVRR